MAASHNESRIVVPFMPTLYHVALVEVGLSLYHQFYYGILKKAFTDLQQADSRAFEEGNVFDTKTFDVFCKNDMIKNGSSIPFKERSKEYLEVSYNQAKESLLQMPNLLREDVMDTVENMHYVAFEWRVQHLKILNIKYEDCTLFWRSDGTIDSNKTAEGIVRNENIYIRERFQMACIFCFEKSIQSLWADMELSGISKNFAMANCSIVSFWIRWMRDGSKIPWTHAILTDFDPSDSENQNDPIPPRFSTFFPLLMPEDRKRFLNHLHSGNIFDFRDCLHTLTKKEEEQMLQKYIYDILYLYLQWPLRSFFLEMVQKVWNYVDAMAYYSLLTVLVSLNRVFTDSDEYSELIANFWINSPDHLKKIASQCPISSVSILVCLSEEMLRRFNAGQWINSNFKRVILDTNEKKKRLKK